MQSSDIDRTPARPRERFALFAAGGAAAFAAYFAMYAFRKPFAAGTYDDMGLLFLGLDYKTGLLIAQVIGYALSKLIGIKIIAEFGRRGRAAAILFLIGSSWLALVLFAVLPPGWGPLCLFLNGLPLGMIWGLVFSYVEGRRCSEVLGAMLCASFIISSGAVKSVAVWLMQQGVSEQWMPVVTGAAFAPLLLVSLGYLERLPPPDARDEAERTVRVPMGRESRAAFFREHGFTMALLVAGYMLLTALRDLRDNFAVELWTAMGLGDVASVFSQSELPVAAIALCGLGALMLVRNNMHALLAMHGVIIFGAGLLGLSTLAFQSGLLGPMHWMILSGAGLYLGYTPFNAMLFDRMIAALGKAGNAGFLIYVADSSGYVGSVALLLGRSFAAPDIDWLPFFIICAYATAILVGVVTLVSALQFIGSGRPTQVSAHA
ncbi:MAG: hypothetical protein CVT77_07045 [Alphaproteobacteria bacterium HGW-Alphaproteobacteria-16]|nr:MAG: hypothetical protein CVT77_07045 [Alphaproteobacteria bacterium HGW-Alphaproteobacteria-16]